MMKKTILLVEDDESFRQALRKLFEKEGFQVREASSGGKGIEFLQKDSIDLVFLDLYLGDMTGLQFLEETRSGSRPPVIVLTAFGDWGIQSEVLARGAIDCLAKPIKRNELIAIVMKTLANAQSKEVRP